MPDNPEMTADEQAARRAERKAAQLKLMDRSTGYWCERDMDEKPFMRLPDDERRYGPPPPDPKYRSAGHVRGQSPDYSECPMTGQIHRTDDGDWWADHYGRLADAAMNAAEEYQLDQHDPDWRGKRGGVHTGNKAVSDKVPEPQRSFLTYAVEEQHGFAHQLKWARVLLSTGYEWEGMMGRQMAGVFRFAEAEGPMDYNECLMFWERHGQNARWSTAKAWFESNGATPAVAAAAEEAPYVYGEDLETAKRDADARGDTLQWAAVAAEIDLALSEKCALPQGVTPEVLDAVESRYPTIRLDRVREHLGHAQRPGSPEWRELQLLEGVTDDLPTWTRQQATLYFSLFGHARFSGPRETANGPVWIDFERDDSGGFRQIDKPVAKAV